MPRMDALAWLQSLSKFGIRPGLERMEVLLTALGEPQRAFAAIHVVGTNGKSTTTRMTEALLLAAGLSVGSTVSPHVRSWSERIQVNGAEADVAAAVAAVRPAAEAAGATQFEVLVAAAFLAFAEAGVDIAVIEAGLGGRWDATNVVGASVVVLTNVALDHTDLLGDTRELIAAEKLAVIRPGATVIVGEAEWAAAARAHGAATVTLGDGTRPIVLATLAAEAHLGRAVDPVAALAVRLPGRAEWRSAAPAELWDGAHNAAGVRFLLAQLAAGHDAAGRDLAGVPAAGFTLCTSILADKGVDEMLDLLAGVAPTVVATSSSSLRALPADELARHCAGRFALVEAVAAPAAALARARELAGPQGAVLVTGSLYLLADLAAAQEHAA